MASSVITVPFIMSLTKESNWHCLDDSKRQFFVARCHFYIDKRISSQQVRYSKELTVYKSVKGVEFTEKRSRTVEHEVIDYQESLRESMRSSEVLSSFVTNLGLSAKNNPFRLIDANIANTESEKLISTFSDSFAFKETERSKVISQVETNIHIGKDEEVEVYCVDRYQRYSWHVFLWYVDYLFVDYECGVWKLRNTRVNRPPYNTKSRTNLLSPKVPVCTLKGWMKSNGGITMVKKAEYKSPLGDDSALTIVAPEVLNAPRGRYVPFPADLPSLYHMSHVAFPSKWVKRKGPWTMEELMAIELEDAKEKATPWYYRFGGGKW